MYDSLEFIYNIIEFIIYLLWDYPILWILPLFIYLLKKYANHSYFKYFYLQTPLFIALFLVILNGFFANRDNGWINGCLVGSQPIFTALNIKYSSISILFAVSALFFQTKNERLLMLCFELLYWLFKLFIINSENYFFLSDIAFEFFALAVRLQLISVVLEKQVKLYKVFLLAAIVVFCKIAFDIVPSMF